MKNLKLYRGNIVRDSEYSEPKPVMVGFGFVLVHEEVTKKDVVKENALLLDIGRRCYVDISNINSIIDVWKVNRRIKKDGTVIDGKWIYDSNGPLFPGLTTESGMYVADVTKIEKEMPKDRSRLLQKIKIAE